MAKSAGGVRKIGRNKVKCERYRAEHIYEKNKIRKLRKITRNLSADNEMRKQSERKIGGLEKSLRR